MTEQPQPPRRPFLRVLAVLALMVALGILAALGTWQAGRFLDARVRFAKMDARLALEPVAVTSASALDESMDFRQVRLTGGELLMDKTAIVQRRFHKHLPGDWTLTPYRFADGSVVIVHTGWVAETHPEMEGNRPAGELVGFVVTPGRVKQDDFVRNSSDFALRDRPVLDELDADFLYQQLDDLQPPPRTNTIVVLNGPARPNVYPTPSYDYITNPYLTPATHLGYAVLWYGSGLLMIWLFWAGWTGRLDPSAR